MESRGLREQDSRPSRAGKPVIVSASTRSGEKLRRNFEIRAEIRLRRSQEVSRVR